MFDTLSDRLQAALGDVRSRGKLTEDDVSKAMRQVRLALLEADVNFKVVKEFTAAVKEWALGQDVLSSLNPGQQVVKIVGDELTRMMGGAGRDLVFDLHDLLAGVERLERLRAQGALLHGRGELLDDLEVHVRLQQREAHLAHRLRDVLLGQLAARADIAEGLLKAV